MKAVADSEDYVQGTRSADYANVILRACFPLPTREEGIAASVSQGMHGGCTGLGHQPAIRRGSKKKNPWMVWKPSVLTCDSFESCLDLHCRGCFKGWQPLVQKKGNLEGLVTVKTTGRVTPGGNWYHALIKEIFQKMAKASDYAAL